MIKLVKQDKENSTAVYKKNLEDLEYKLNVSEERTKFLEEQIKKGTQSNNNSNSQMMEIQKKMENMKINYEQKISGLNLEVSELKGKLQLSAENTQDLLEQLEKSKGQNKSLRHTIRDTTNEEVEKYKKLSENYKSQCDKLQENMRRLEEKTLKMVELVKKERQQIQSQQKSSSSPPTTTNRVKKKKNCLNLFFFLI